jgi:hypothetical protein
MRGLVGRFGVIQTHLVCHTNICIFLLFRATGTAKVPLETSRSAKRAGLEVKPPLGLATASDRGPWRRKPNKSVIQLGKREIVAANAFINIREDHQ